MPSSRLTNKRSKNVTVKCFNGKDKNYLVKEEICHTKSKYQEIMILDTFKFGRCLFLNGIIQSCQKHHAIYDNEMLRYVNVKTKDLLLLGGGDGNLLFRSLEKNPEIIPTIVEIDEQVISVCEKHIHKSLFEHKNVRVIINDALEFLKYSSKEKYDQIVIDITDNPIGIDPTKLIDSYVDFIRLSYNLLKKNSYLSAYIGCDLSIVESVQERLNLKMEQSVLNIPSFGEKCYIIHILKL